MELIFLINGIYHFTLISSSLNKESILSNKISINLFEISENFLNLIPSEISTEQTELLSNYDHQEQEAKVDSSLIERLFSLLKIIENCESFFLSNNQILKIRDLLKEKKIDLKNSPNFINNIRIRFTRAQQKLVSILKFSSQNFFKEKTPSGGSKGLNLHSNIYYVDYSPSKAQNAQEILDSQNSENISKIRFSPSPTKNKRSRSKIEKVKI